MKRLHWVNRLARRALGCAAGLVLVPFLAPTGARAEGGLFVTPDVLGAPIRASLGAEIDAARRAHPEAFAAVAELQGAAREADRKKRGRLAPMSLYFKALGPDALMPMLERLAFAAPTREMGLPDSAWEALGVGMLDAVGALRDARARPVLSAVLRHARTAGTAGTGATLRAAAGALGRVCDAGAAGELIAMAEGQGGLPVLEALGHCRRPEVAAALARAADPVGSIDGKADHKRVWLVARALADLGNVRGDADEAVRKSAASTLLRIFVRGDVELQRTATTSLLVVAWAGTEPMIIEQRRGASPALAAELDHLLARVRRNPVL